jgi:high-affinity iron transporter
MLATLVIFLREGVEASMIVAILLAYLNRIGRRDHFRDVFLGVGAALVLAAAGGVAAYLTIRSYDGSRVQTIFETATYLVAAAVLTYMTFWMRDHARSLSSELRRRTDAALDGRARWGLGLLAFQAVGREGLETVVFTLAIVFSTSAASAMGGAAIGLAGALGIAFVIYRLGHRLNLGRFFTVIGVLLMAFAAGLLANVIENLQQLGWLPLLSGPLWHSGQILSEDSSFGDVLHSFFGYSDAPTILQLLVYFGYLAIVIITYLGLASRLRRSRTAIRAPESRQSPAASQAAGGSSAAEAGQAAAGGGNAAAGSQAAVGAQAASYRPSGASGGAASRYQPSPESDDAGRYPS